MQCKPSVPDNGPALSHTGPTSHVGYLTQVAGETASSFIHGCYIFSFLRQVLNYRHIFPRRDRAKQKDETPHPFRERPSCPWTKGTILDLRPVSDLESCILRVVSYIYFIALFSIRGLTCQIKAALLNCWYVTVCYLVGDHNVINLNIWLKL